MLDFIRQWVINIVTLVLFIVIVEMLLPGGKMKKYINLVTGTILVIVIINPLTGLAGKKFDFTASQTKNNSLLEKTQLQKDGKKLEQAQLKQIIEVYRKNIIDQLEQNAEEIGGVKDAQADVIIDEDYRSAAFGEIKRAYISITADNINYSGGTDTKGAAGIAGKGSDRSETGKKGGGIRNGIVPVEKVQAVEIGSEAPNGQASGKCDPKLRGLVEDRISRVFGVDRQNIVITQV